MGSQDAGSLTDFVIPAPNNAEVRLMAALRAARPWNNAGNQGSLQTSRIGRPLFVRILKRKVIPEPAPEVLDSRTNQL